MKSGEKHNPREGLKKEQLRRRVFTLDFKAEAAQHKQAENPSSAECGYKFDVLPKLIQHWEKQFETGKLMAAGRCAVNPEQARSPDCALNYRDRRWSPAPKKAAASFAKDSL